MPYPMAIGGALMGYPASVDTGQILPFSGESGEPAAGGSSVLVANTAYLVGVAYNFECVMTGIRAVFAAGGAGHYDLGIYDASGANSGPGNLLANCAATATSLATVTGPVTPSFINGNLPLGRGRYWLAFWVDNATDTVYRISSPSSSVVVVKSGTTAGPLPALASSLTGLANNSKKISLVPTFLGSWS